LDNVIPVNREGVLEAVKVPVLEEGHTEAYMHAMQSFICFDLTEENNEMTDMVHAGGRSLRMMTELDHRDLAAIDRVKRRIVEDTATCLQFLNLLNKKFEPWLALGTRLGTSPINNTIIRNSDILFISIAILN
jgi:hypothetical protein